MGLASRVFVLIAAVGLSAGFTGVSAQDGPGSGVGPQRDCQTLLTCRYGKSGSWRGCVSSFSCRVCTFVPASCSIGGSRGKVCSRLRCTWGA